MIEMEINEWRKAVSIIATGQDKPLLVKELPDGKYKMNYLAFQYESIPLTPIKQNFKDFPLYIAYKRCEQNAEVLAFQLQPSLYLCYFVEVNRQNEFQLYEYGIENGNKIEGFEISHACKKKGINDPRVALKEKIRSWYMEKSNIRLKVLLGQSII